MGDQMSLKDCWHPVGLSHSFEVSSSAGTRLFDQELVVWRDSSGAAHVWEDRCPHRGMKLSFGFVRGDHIACLYHGWQYDTAGQCRHIPAHPTLDVPRTIKVPTYSAEEKFGMVWATAAADTALPDIDVAEVTPVRSLYIDCPEQTVREALDALGIASLADGAGILAHNGDGLLLALQCVSPVRTALHIVILGSPDVHGGAGQKHIAHWAESLRFLLENPDVAEVA